MFKELSVHWPRIKKYRWWYLAGILFLALTSGLQLLIPQFVRVSIDVLGTPDFRVTQLTLPILGIVGTAILVALGRLGWRLFIQGAARRIEAELREDLFSHTLALGRSFYQTQNVGDLMALATNDLNAIRMALSMALVAAFDGIFMTVGIITILVLSQDGLPLWYLAPLPVITFLILYLGKFIGPLFKNVQESFAQLTRQVQEGFSGIRLIQSFALEDRFLRRFGLANKDYQDRNMALVSTWGLLFPVVGFLSGLTTLLLILFGGKAVVLGTISPGTLVSTISYLQLLIWPMLGAGFTVNLIQRGEASSGRLNTILRTKPDIVTTKPLPPPPIMGSITCKNLTFTYPGRTTPAISNLDLEVAGGQWLGITGPVGSGKSTLWQALARLYPVSESSIWIDGLDICRWDPHELRKRFALAPQDSFLFSETLRDNIFFGTDEQDMALFDLIVNATTMDRDIKTFPQGWETEVGERGITLSGGQKQRVALARALITQAPIMVLDDSFANVDAETERFMIKRLGTIRGGKTTIIISHRISAMEACDRIIVLNQGTIQQQGSHQALTLSPGYYQDVWRLQGGIPQGTSL